MSRKADREAAALLVGKAFRCPDGIVRWITGLSVRDYFQLLWLDERDGAWHSGGIVKFHKWEGGEEVPAPQSGDRYTLMGSMGTPTERTV